jgi:hypothetical protein
MFNIVVGFIPIDLVNDRFYPTMISFIPIGLVNDRFNTAIGLI